MSEYTTATIVHSGTCLRTPKDPPRREDGVCALDGCDRKLPKLALQHGDPFHSALCCRTFYGLTESEIAGAQLGWPRSERMHGSNRYREGCRCEVCRAEASAQRRNYRNPRRDAARKRERYATDPEYRDRVLAYNRRRRRGSNG